MVQKHMVFSQYNELLAIPLDSVQEVLQLDKIRRIHRASDRFVGIINLRGNILPILNFSKFIFPGVKQDGMAGIAQSNNVYTALVLKFNKDTYGMIVDDIKKIVEFSDENYDSIPTDIETKIELPLIENIANVGGSLIKCINLEKILQEKFSINTTRAQETRPVAESQPAFKVAPAKKSASAGKAKKPVREQVATEALTEFSKDQLDALKEISNIATGKAVIAMSKLFKAKAKISIIVEDVLIKKIDEIGNSSIINVDDNVIGIRSIIKNDLDASIFLVFQVEQMKNLLKLMKDMDSVSTEITSIESLDAQTESALIEFGNIIVSHYCAGISDFLKVDVLHDVPTLGIDSYGALLDGEIAKLAATSNQALVLKTIIETQKKSIVGEIIFIPYNESIDKIVKWLDVDKIVEILQAEADGLSVQDLQKVQTDKLKIRKNDSEEETLEIIDASKNLEGDIMAMVRTQSDFAIDAEQSEVLQIDDADLDTFRELGNMGAGNAGNALSQMLNKKVYLEIPPAKILGLEDLKALPIAQTPMSVGYISATQGLFKSIILLIFSVDHIENLLQAIMETKTKKTLKKESDLTENERSAVQEMMNILMGHYVAAMSNFLKVKIEPPENKLFFKKTSQIFKQLKLDDNNQDIKAVVIETSIDAADVSSIKGTFILLLHPQVIHNILNRIKEIW